MIVGIVLGMAIGLLGIFWMIYGFETERWVLTIILIILSFAIPMFIGGQIGKYEDKIEYLKYIESYKSKKEIIETELKNKSVEELEKIGIFNDIISINSELAKTKIEYNKWYYFYLDKSKIEELEPIKIGEE